MHHNSALAVKFFTGSYEAYELNVQVLVTGNVIEIIISGTTAQQLSTAGGYVTAAMISAIKPYIPSSGILKYVNLNNIYFGQITVDQNTGSIRIGYTRKISNGESENIPVGINIYVKETFVIN